MSQKDYILKRKFESLFREHFIALCYFADKYAAKPGTSAEIVHSVFRELWVNRNYFDFEKPAKMYLFSAVYNQCVNTPKNNKKQEAETNSINNFQDTSVFEESINKAETERKVKSAIELLPVKCRETFIMSRFKEIKHKDIATKLNVPLKTVEIHISKALKILRNELSRYLLIN